MQSLTINDETMPEIHFIKGSININSDAEDVWQVLTERDKIKLYIGSAVETDWKTGSDIEWNGEHGGIAYKDKGKVLESNPGKILKYTYWSSSGGTEDSPDNYSAITWSLENSMKGLTTLTYTRENIPTLEERAMFEEHLPAMLDEIKRLAEEPAE